MRGAASSILGAASLALVFGAAGCDRRVLTMRDQPRYEADEPAAMFAEGTVVRQRVPGTVARSDELGLPPPPPVTLANLRRGQELFGVWCLPCHGAGGHGDGMIVQRGYPRPPSFHTPEARAYPDEYMVRVIREGLGKMPSYGDLVDEEERRLVVMYVRALQLSQHAEAAELPPELVARLDGVGLDGTGEGRSNTGGGRDAAPEGVEGGEGR